MSASNGSVAIGNNNYGIVNIANGSILQSSEDIGSILAAQCRRQLEYEKRSGKYIPDVFVETRETKNLVRTFSHPVLFLTRTLEAIDRLNLPATNRFLTKAGLPILPCLDLHGNHTVHTLNDVCASVTQISIKLSEITTALEAYERESQEEPLPFPIKPGCEPFYEQNNYLFRWGFGWGVKKQINERVDELKAAQARVFILTGRAGQGKTNFVCDFVERFLLKHEIPCAYLSVRTISSLQVAEVGEAVQRLIFNGEAHSFPNAAKLLSLHAAKLNKPFVLVVDGLNEHPRILEFSKQMEHFVDAVLEYPNIKLLLTCRSEFFQQRFGNLIEMAAPDSIFVHDEHERLRDEERYDEMQQSYFSFFEVRSELVSEQVIESLKTDILLLRFFCEAYGAKGKPADYQQPKIENIYREHIFKIYLEKKLGSADLFMQQASVGASRVGNKCDLRAILEGILKHMLDSWHFSDVPVSAIPVNLRSALDALLDEELVLRRDAPTGLSVFSQEQETINFTFDEFRDYLLAQYLLYRIYATDVAEFNKHIEKNDPKDSQIVEGIKKFLFYASRHKENEGFWDFYRHKSWYADVFSYEIFNIDAKLIRSEDVKCITEILKIGGEKARAVARKLAISWHSKRHPLLNLDLLLSIVTSGDDLQINNLIMANFKPDWRGDRSSLASSFCKFVAEKVLPDFNPTTDEAEKNLFRLLVLLLPVDANANLDSECMDLFRKVLEQHHDFGIGLLADSLQYRPTLHMPYVGCTWFSRHGLKRTAPPRTVPDSRSPVLNVGV